MWSAGEGNGKPLQYYCLENFMNSMKRQNDRILKEELPRLVGAQNATGYQWRNNSRKKEGMEPKQKKYPLINAGDIRDVGSSISGRSPWRRTWQPTPVFLPGESRGQRSLVGYGPWGRKELDTTEQLTN